eukprot:TRINITY_DN2090_c0_g2_i1.p1 TRINITY_DN2090_c0_g2~~TRINITY_DN2090_c0_g2_i1.p1  ORF type:complete len:611 (-),score=92.26 TRINITY_DN2090_c0_g2_i1:520-2295(-)
MARAVLFASLVAPGFADKVTIETVNGKAKLVSSETGVLGDDGTMRGAGGWTRLEKARASGADSLRTWHIDDLGNTLGEAEQHGLRVSSGIWLTHNASAYQNCTDLEADPFWQSELELFLKAVTEHRDSQALLWWTIGNELELEVSWTHGSECLWKRLEWVVSAVKKADPNHPVGTVTNGIHAGKVGLLARICTSCDFLGVNAYGEESLHVADNLQKWGWYKPFALTEYGPTGHWLLPVTSWDSYIEETSTVKAERYRDTCTYCRDVPTCIGSFAFYWGWKWEKTGTWYGLFNEWETVTRNVGADCPECQSEVVNTLQKCWLGEAASSAPPSIEALEVNGKHVRDAVFKVAPQSEVSLYMSAAVRGAEDTALQTVWALTEDSPSTAIGGAFEDSVPLIETAFESSVYGAFGTGLGNSATMITHDLELGKKYRLYAFVRKSGSDFLGKPAEQEAHATYAIHTCHETKPGEECFEAIRAAQNNASYHYRRPGVHADSPLSEWQMMLFQSAGESKCPMPCEVEDDWCHTTQEGEECHEQITWAKYTGIFQHPEKYPGLNSESSLEDFQFLFHRTDSLRHHGCTRPCITRYGWMLR